VHIANTDKVSDIFIMAKLLVKVFELFKYLKNSVMMNEKENIQDENLEQNENNQEQETTQEQAAELSQEEILSNKLAEANDKYARLVAEFDNYKKRTSKERVELIQTASQGVISKLLTVLDDFDRALNAMATAQDVESVKQGVELVNNKFRKILENEGLKEMNVVGEAFDADFLLLTRT
jgi:molecular chaperone GrpE